MWVLMWLGLALADTAIPCEGADGTTAWEDLDGDGWGSGAPVDGCPLAEGFAGREGDCDDRPSIGAAVNPDAEEVCDGLDNDCDGVIDGLAVADAREYFLDADGDGWGDEQVRVRACGQPVGYVERAGDCDDNLAQVSPDEFERCDGVDNNCLNGVDEEEAIDGVRWYRDADGDGFGDEELFFEGCAAPAEGGPWVRAGRPLDCDDNDPAVLTCAVCSGCCCETVGARSSLALVGAALVGLRRRGRRTWH